MPSRTNRKIEFGDFQTPDTLARKICELLSRSGISPRSMLEPTCGKGAFLRATTDCFPDCAQVVGFEINADYVHIAKSVDRADVYCEDFFEKDWPETLNTLEEPILVLGNPPWVTNSALGRLDGANLPAKSNFRRLDGFEAITGKSNFDISEWMLLHLLEWLSGRNAVLAMLCKTAVARKVLHHAWSRNLQIASASMYLINADKYFNASVDACLLVSILKPGRTSEDCFVFPSLDETELVLSKFALHDGRLIADLDSYNEYGHLAGISPIRWRSGVKHDCSSVMELTPKGLRTYENKLGDKIDIETTNLYPMLKSSDLMRQQQIPSRYMLITQRSVGEDTSHIRLDAPRTWQYLQSHAGRLDRRLSSIYRNRPQFSVFGVGPYSFAPWKIATSGFSKSLEFHCVGPFEGKPVVFDDTCYFLPCRTEDDAQVLYELLNSKAAKGFFHSFIFWDAKRPITAQLLGTLDLRRLAQESGLPLPFWSNISSQTMPLFT